MENQQQLVHPENLAGKLICQMADPETDNESTRLLSIFPSEVWMLIFDNIFSPEDLNRLRKSCDFFHKLLPKTKTLFAEVIKFLNIQFPSGKHGKVAPDLLRCRLACRTWQVGVDSFLPSSSNYSKLLQVENQQSRTVPLKTTDTQFWTPEQPAAFLQHFDKDYAGKPGNPFVTRSVYIFYGYERYVPDAVSFTNKLLQILKLYGHHIWEFGLHLIFSRDPFTPTNIWCYNILRDFLQLMPNLKVLKFGCFGTRLPSDDKWKALELSLESCVFPELKNLRHLQMSNVPTVVFDALLRRYSYVPMLSSRASHVANFARSDLQMFKHQMPNLEQVAILLTDSNEFMQLDASSALWPLKTLIICMELHRGRPDWQQLFQFLENRWAATLTELKIDMDLRFFDHPYPIQILPNLKLPNLKVFWFESTSFVPLDFILPMRNSLERLVIRYRTWANEVELESQFESEGEIKFYKFHNNLMDSNIWKLFPNLGTVDFLNLQRPFSVLVYRRQ